MYVSCITNLSIKMNASQRIRKNPRHIIKTGVMKKSLTIRAKLNTNKEPEEMKINFILSDPVIRRFSSDLTSIIAILLIHKKISANAARFKPSTA